MEQDKENLYQHFIIKERRIERRWWSGNSAASTQKMAGLKLFLFDKKTILLASFSTLVSIRRTCANKLNKDIFDNEVHKIQLTQLHNKIPYKFIYCIKTF